MPTPAHLTASIRRLCDLESGRGPLASALSDSEKRFEIGRLRSIIPVSILAHHDRMLQRGKRTIVPALDGACSACHRRLPASQLARLRTCQDLEVCDGCGTFIYLESKRESRSSGSAKPSGVKSKAAAKIRNSKLEIRKE
jgi:hypothetical protein